MRSVNPSPCRIVDQAFCKQVEFDFEGLRDKTPAGERAVKLFDDDDNS
jgi:hypothetical protein